MGRLALLTLLATIACREEAAPSYVRISGPAPKVSGVPPAAAGLVVFWASWCAPCREETPALEQLAKAPPAGLQVFVVGEDQDPDAVRSFLGRSPPPGWNFRHDQQQQLFGAFGVDKLPVAFLVVRGQLVARFSGPQDWTSRGMRRLLERLMREGAGPPA